MSDSLMEVANLANNKLFALSGLTKMVETWVQWGLRGDSTDEEIDSIIRDYLDYKQDKAKARL